MSAGLLLVSLACCVLMGDCLPTTKAGKPCSAAMLHVRASNQELGTWALQLGQLQGRVDHQRREDLPADGDAGDWGAALYNRDEGCSDSDVQNFVAAGNGEVVEAGGGRPEIPSDYDLVEGVGAYKLHPEAVGWIEAESVCESEGSRLAVVNSKQEAAVLIKKLKEEAGSDVWRFHVGLYWSVERDDFYTVGGVSIGQTGYEIWGRNQPDDYNEIEVCVDLATSAELFDCPCSSKQPFFCEIEI